MPGRFLFAGISVEYSFESYNRGKNGDAKMAKMGTELGKNGDGVSLLAYPSLSLSLSRGCPLKGTASWDGLSLAIRLHSVSIKMVQKLLCLKSYQNPSYFL